MSATIKKIAELAGVSIGTVDRALHGRSGIKPEVAKRIVEIANSLDYKANIAAKAMVLKRNPVKIGVVLHVQMNLFFDEVVKGIYAASEEIKDFGITVKVKCGRNYNVEDQLRLIDEMLFEGINALVIVPLNDERVINKINELHSAKMPVVLLFSNAEKAEKLVYVGCDFFKVGRIAAGLVGMITGGTGSVLYATSSLGMLSNLHRMKGFKDGLAARHPGIKLIGVSEFSNDDDMSYHQALDEFKSLPHFDTIMMATGSKVGVFKAMEELGLLSEVKTVALDLSQPIVDRIEKGIVAASIVQHPFLHGYRVIKVLFDYYILGTIPTQDASFIECDIRIYENLF